MVNSILQDHDGSVTSESTYHVVGLFHQAVPIGWFNHQKEEASVASAHDGPVQDGSNVTTL